MRTAGLLVVFGIATALLGCGQKGPLVLPDAQHVHKKIGVKPPVSGTPIATPAPATTPVPADAAPRP